MAAVTVRRLKVTLLGYSADLGDVATEAATQQALEAFTALHKSPAFEVKMGNQTGGPLSNSLERPEVSGSLTKSI